MFGGYVIVYGRTIVNFEDDTFDIIQMIWLFCLHKRVFEHPYSWLSFVVIMLNAWTTKVMMMTMVVTMIMLMTMKLNMLLW